MSKREEKKVKGTAVLRYEKSDSDSSVLSAARRNAVAEEIKRIGKEDIFIHEDEGLFNSLYRLEMGGTVPLKLYFAVAEFIAFVYNINERKTRGEI